MLIVCSFKPFEKKKKNICIFIHVRFPLHSYNVTQKMHHVNTPWRYTVVGLDSSLPGWLLCSPVSYPTTHAVQSCVHDSLLSHKQLEVGSLMGRHWELGLILMHWLRWSDSEWVSYCMPEALNCVKICVISHALVLFTLPHITASHISVYMNVQYWYKMQYWKEIHAELPFEYYCGVKQKVTCILSQIHKGNDAHWLILRPNKQSKSHHFF